MSEQEFVARTVASYIATAPDHKKRVADIEAVTMNAIGAYHVMREFMAKVAKAPIL